MIQILLVEDELDWRKAIKSYLERGLRDLDYELHMAHNKGDALDHIREHKVDVAIIDVSLVTDSDLLGFEVLQDLIEIQPRARSIVITSYPTAEREKEAYRLGADYLSRMTAPLHRLLPERIRQAVVRAGGIE